MMASADDEPKSTGKQVSAHRSALTGSRDEQAFCRSMKASVAVGGDVAGGAATLKRSRCDGLRSGREDRADRVPGDSSMKTCFSVSGTACPLSTVSFMPAGPFSSGNQATANGQGRPVVASNPNWPTFLPCQPPVLVFPATEAHHRAAAKPDFVRCCQGLVSRGGFRKFHRISLRGSGRFCTGTSEQRNAGHAAGCEISP